jgi:hypothetical protein
MFTITTKHVSNASGRSQVKATGHGKQRTVNVDQSVSTEANHGSAAGALLNVLLSDEQQAKVRHPSGGKRVRADYQHVGGGKFKTVWTVDV